MNTVGNLLNAYYNKINGLVSGFNLYKITVPLTEKGNFILIYPESGGDDDNKSKKVEEVVIRVDIITKFMNDADQTAVEDADTLIKVTINPDNGNALGPAAGLQVLNVKRENYTYLTESDGVNTYYRKITRYTNRIIQT